MKNKKQLIQNWKQEEVIAHIKGWDFSHIAGRYQEEDTLPWDYGTLIRSFLQAEHMLLDMGTGGGEFLLSLEHPYENTAATESYPPNIALCEQTLLPLGMDFRPTDDKNILPFADESFDVIINRHDSYLPTEVYRCLKKGGVFITQQVGAENDKDLVRLLLGSDSLSQYPDQHLTYAIQALEQAGFTILQAEESKGSIRFFDVGALVWFARIIEWEFVGFSVDSHTDGLMQAQAILEQQGEIRGTTHRYMLVGRK